MSDSLRPQNEDTPALINSSGCKVPIVPGVDDFVNVSLFRSSSQYATYEYQCICFLITQQNSYSPVKKKIFFLLKKKKSWHIIAIGEIMVARLIRNACLLFPKNSRIPIVFHAPSHTVGLSLDCEPSQSRFSQTDPSNAAGMNESTDQIPLALFCK